MYNKEHDDDGFNFDEAENSHEDFETGEFHHDEFNEDEHIHDEEDEHGQHIHEEEYHQHEEEEEEEEPKKDKKSSKSGGKKGISKFIMPVGFGILALGGGLFGYNFYESHYATSSLTPSAHTNTAFNAPPRIPGNPNLVHHVAPPMVQKPVMPQAPVVSAPQADDSLNVAPDVHTPAPIAAPVQAPAPVSHSDGDDISQGIKSLIEVTKNMDTDLSSRFEKMNDRLAQTSDAITSRLDKTDSHVSDLATHVTNLDHRMNDFDKQLKDIEGSGVQHKTVVASVAKPRTSVVRHASKHIERRAGHIDEKPLNGYVLRGVEKGDNPQSAWVQSPSGYLLVRVGEPSKGIGSVRSIKPKGNTWVVVTDKGEITP